MEPREGAYYYLPNVHYSSSIPYSDTPVHGVIAWCFWGSVAKCSWRRQGQRASWSSVLLFERFWVICRIRWELSGGSQENHAHVDTYRVSSMLMSPSQFQGRHISLSIDSAKQRTVDEKHARVAVKVPVETITAMSGSHRTSSTPYLQRGQHAAGQSLLFACF